MMTSQLRTAYQRGIALLGALVVVAAVALGASTLLDQQAVLTQTLLIERDRTQADWLLRAGLDWARSTLQRDARQNSVTRADGLWAQPVTGLRIDLPGSTRVAWLSGLIQDEQSKFNLRDLLPGNARSGQSREQAQRLLQLLGLPPEWAATFEQRLIQSQTGQFYWKSVLDLLPQQNLSATQQRLLLDHFTLLPSATALNINTASAAVLSVSIDGLELAQAQSIVAQRERGQWFNSVGDFLNRINMPASYINRSLDIGSRWFMVQGQVSLDHASRHMLALLYRPDDETPAIRWIKE